MAIRGTSLLYLVIGDPVAQTKSPALYSDWCEAANIDAVFTPFQIHRAQGVEVFAALRNVPNLCGMVVTIPFKPLAGELCDSLTVRAAAAGAVNVVQVMPDGRWHGDALDGFGCVAALRQRDIKIADARVMIVGAGGAGASVAAALAEAGVSQLMVDDLEKGRAAALAARLSQVFPSVETGTGQMLPDEIDILVNASPAGMKPNDPLPVSPDLLSARPVLIEMIMQPARTRLVELAEAHGCQIVPGGEVLEGQFDETLRFFGLKT